MLGGSIDSFGEDSLRFKRTTDRYCLFWVPKKGVITRTAINLRDGNNTDGVPQVKRLGHNDGLSKLILKLREALKETVITTLRLEIAIKSVFCNTILELSETNKEIRNKAMIDKISQRKRNK